MTLYTMMLVQLFNPVNKSTKPLSISAVVASTLKISNWLTKILITLPGVVVMIKIAVRSISMKLSCREQKGRNEFNNIQIMNCVV